MTWSAISWPHLVACLALLVGAVVFAARLCRYSATRGTPHWDEATTPREDFGRNALNACMHSPVRVGARLVCIECGWVLE